MFRKTMKLTFYSLTVPLTGPTLLLEAMNHKSSTATHRTWDSHASSTSNHTSVILQKLAPSPVQRSPLPFHSTPHLLYER